MAILAQQEIIQTSPYETVTLSGMRSIDDLHIRNNNFIILDSLLTYAHIHRKELNTTNGDVHFVLEIPKKFESALLPNLHITCNPQAVFTAQSSNKIVVIKGSIPSDQLCDECVSNETLYQLLQQIILPQI